MSIRKVLLAIICSLFVASAVNAACMASGCYDEFVDQIYIQANGSLYVQTSGTETLANCTPDSGVYLFLAGTASKFKEVYATLMYAQAMGLRAKIRVIEGTNPCEIAWVAVDRP